MSREPYPSMYCPDCESTYDSPAVHFSVEDGEEFVVICANSCHNIEKELLAALNFLT